MRTWAKPDGSGSEFLNSSCHIDVFLLLVFVLC